MLPINLKGGKAMSGNVDTRGLVGFATVNGTVTGGAGGKTVTVSNANDFLKYVKMIDPIVIKVSGSIVLTKRMHQISSNKTILGLGSSAQITNGGLYLNRVANVIIQNITFANASDD